MGVKVQHTDAQLLALWNEGRRIDAIKLFRAERDATLVQAKDAMEGMAKGLPHCFPVLPVSLDSMGLRDYFAAQYVVGTYRMSMTFEDAARQAYMMADAMLAARMGGSP